MHSRLAWRRAAMSRSRCACRQGQSHGATASGAACVRRLPGARRALTGRGAARGRALLLNAAGTLAVSGGADHTLRLWDLGQQRCLQAFAVHTDSVWALAAPPDLGLVFSGGRDRCVYRRAPRARAGACAAPPAAQRCVVGPAAEHATAYVVKALIGVARMRTLQRGAYCKVMAGLATQQCLTCTWRCLPLVSCTRQDSRLCHAAHAAAVHACATAVRCLAHS